MKSSEMIRHPTETDGKYPQRLFFPKRDEPSERIAALNKYFPL